MKLKPGKIVVYEGGAGHEEALHFRIDGNEHWMRRYLNNGRYEVRGLLAIGGFGCVFGALDKWNYDHKVVIKTPFYMGSFCRSYISRSQNVFERQIKSLNKLYEREKKYLVRLSNAGFDSIVNLNEYFTDRSLDLCKPFRDAAGVQYYVSENLRENAPFLVMKYIQGESLKEILDKYPLNQSKTLRLARQILILMEYLHQPRKSKRGRPFYYMFCDLKADNILITEGEEVTLIDLGSHQNSLVRSTRSRSSHFCNRWLRCPRSLLWRPRFS